LPIIQHYPALTLNIFPNPTNNAFTVEFEVLKRSDAVLKLYTQQGEELRTLSSQVFEAGKHQIEGNGEGLRQGTYTCTLQALKFR
jgi:Secretion system C-terminal sorting domain